MTEDNAVDNHVSSHFDQARVGEVVQIALTQIAEYNRSRKWQLPQDHEATTYSHSCFAQQRQDINVSLGNQVLQPLQQRLMDYTTYRSQVVKTQAEDIHAEFPFQTLRFMSGHLHRLISSTCQQAALFSRIMHLWFSEIAGTDSALRADGRLGPQH